MQRKSAAHCKWAFGGAARTLEGWIWYCKTVRNKGKKKKDIWNLPKNMPGRCK